MKLATCLFAGAISRIVVHLLAPLCEVIILGVRDLSRLIVAIFINDLFWYYIALHEVLAGCASFFNMLEFSRSRRARLLPRVRLAQLSRRWLERIDAGPQPDRLARCMLNGIR
jgi:hypothetical protein